MRNVIYPSILVYNVESLCRQIEGAAAFAEGVQLDIQDGKFVPDTTFQDIDRIAACKTGSLFFELHLMVENPEAYIKPWEKIADSYILHIETIADPRPVIQEIRLMKKEVGLAISPATPIDAIEPFVKDVDMILVMTVEPGKQGQSYIPEMESKIRTLREKYPELPIEVDGGINQTTIVTAKRAGANIFAPGSALWGRADEKDARGTFLELQRLVDSI